MSIDPETREACTDNLIWAYDAYDDESWDRESSWRIKIMRNVGAKALDAVLSTLKERGYTVAKLEQVGGCRRWKPGFRTTPEQFAVNVYPSRESGPDSATMTAALEPWEPVFRVIESDPA